MNHLGMSVAPTSLTIALDSVGKDFDVEEKTLLPSQWRNGNKEGSRDLKTKAN